MVRRTSVLKYRMLASKAHPDAGGSEDEMARLNVAVEEARRQKTEAA